MVYLVASDKHKEYVVSDHLSGKLVFSCEQTVKEVFLFSYGSLSLLL